MSSYDFMPASEARAFIDVPGAESAEQLLKRWVCDINCKIREAVCVHQNRCDAPLFSFGVPPETNRAALLQIHAALLAAGYRIAVDGIHPKGAALIASLSIKW